MSTSSTVEPSFQALRDAVKAQRLEVLVDVHHLCHPHCPLIFDYLKTRIAYGYLILMAALGVGLWLLAQPRMTVFVVLGIGTVAYWFGFRYVAEAWIRRIIRDDLLGDPERWKKIWRYGGLTVRTIDGNSTAVSPKGDWESLVETQAPQPA